MRIPIVLVLLLPIVYALQIQVLNGNLVDDTITITAPMGQQAYVELKIINDKTVPVTVTLNYNGATISLFKDNFLIQTSPSINYNFVLSPLASTTLKFVTTIGGYKTGSLVITSTDGFSKSYVLKFAATEEKTVQDTSSCLVALTPRRYLTMLVNQTQYVTLYFKNKCNHYVELIDLILEGVPKTVATIYEASLPDELDPYEILKVTLRVSTQPFTKSTTLTFYVKLIGSYEEETYIATTDIILDILSNEEEVPHVSPPSPPSTEEKPTVKNVVVNYTTEGNKLVILKVEPTDAKVYIFIKREGKEEKITYEGPLDLLPNTEYCIYAYKEGYIPFYKCFKTKVRQLCYSIEPSGKKLGDTLYFPINTTIHIKAYDCNTYNPISSVVLIVDGSRIRSSNFTIKTTTPITITIDAGYDYEKKTFKVAGYIPVTFSLPTIPGNYTITIEGSGAESATVKIIYLPNNTVIYQGTGKEHKVLLNYTGTYKIIVTTPFETVEKTFTIFNISTINNNKKSSHLLSTIWSIIWPWGLSIAGIVLAMWLYVRKHEEVSLEAVVQKAVESATQQ